MGVLGLINGCSKLLLLHSTVAAYFRRLFSPNIT